MQRAQQQITAILNDIPGALKYVEDAEKNRAQVYKYGRIPGQDNAQQPNQVCFHNMVAGLGIAY